ncbi:MAG: hypothetical protein O3A37_02085 [Planctomycetota bacterium]|nr:hypothetical protein [Planctomycetota bacterium]
MTTTRPDHRVSSRRATHIRRRQLLHPETLERRDCPAAFILSPVTDTVTEGNAAEFRLTMLNASRLPETVVVSTESITATLGTDYMFRTQRLTFFPGETQKSIFVQSLIDPVNTAEGKEILNLVVNPIGGTPQELTALVTIDDFAPQSFYTIDFSFDSSVPSSVQALFPTAAARWENVIVGDLPDVTDPTTGQVIDDLLIQVSVSNTLPAGVIAQAGFTDIRVGNTGVPANGNFSQNGLPYIGTMQISSAFINAVGLGTTIAHEIGHVVGFGTLWQNNVGTFPTLVSGIGTTNPVYVGTNGVQSYNSVFRNADTSVPLYEVSTTTPPAYDGSYGTHWRDSVFNSYTTPPIYGELMTANYQVNGFLGQPVPAYLSRVTVGALDDFGYTVSYAGAEAYSPPSSSSQTSTAVVFGANKTLELANSIHLQSPTAGATTPAPPPPATPPTGTHPAPPPARTTPPQTAPAPAIFGPLGRATIVAARRLPPRLTFPDRAPIVLTDDEASRTLVWESLGSANNSPAAGPLDFQSLNDEKRIMLMTWASLGMSPFSGPSLSTDGFTIRRRM